MADLISEQYNRLLSNFSTNAPVIADRAKTTKIKGLPWGSGLLIDQHLPKIKANPAPYLESLKKINPEKVKRFMEQNPDLFKGVSLNRDVPKVASVLFDKSGSYLSVETDKETIKETLKQFLVQGSLATAVNAALLGGGSLLLRKPLPEFSKLLMGAAKGGVKFLNPVFTYKTLSRIPQASKLFAKQMQHSDSLIRKSDSELAEEAMKRVGGGSGSHEKADFDAIRDYTKKYNQTPAETIEDSIGVISGFTGLGGAGVAATQPLLEDKTPEGRLSRAINELKKIFTPQSKIRLDII